MTATNFSARFTNNRTATRASLIALMDEVAPEIEPYVQRNPNMWGDDPQVDARNQERECLENFIDAMFERGFISE